MSVKLSPKASPDARLKAVEAVAETLRKDTRPILLGPFRSELGFESSYWLPFLAGLKRRVPDFDKRASVVTRGGLAPIYKAVAHQGMDLYRLRTVTEVRRENLYDQKHNLAKTKGKAGLKQLGPTDWDEKALHDAADALKIGPLFHTVHPSLMYWACAPYWEGTAGLNHLLNLCDYTPLEKIALPDAELPKAYIAVRFYARATFPYPDPETSEFVAHTVAVLAQHAPVVLLTTGETFDDHWDVPIVGENVHTLPDLQPEEHLAVHLAVMCGAKAFVGTYGGVAQTALRLQVPSVSFWQQFGGTSHAHLALQHWLSAHSGTPFLAGSIADAHLWGQVTHPPGVRRVSQPASGLQAGPTQVPARVVPPLEAVG